MARKVDITARLVEESRDLAELGRGVQSDRELLATEEQINELVQRYQAWFAQALTVVPEEFRDRLRAEFDGSWHTNKIKHFLQSPGEVSIFGQSSPDGEPSPLPYWSYPYDTTFHGPLLAQRQILMEAQQALLGAGRVSACCADRRRITVDGYKRKNRQVQGPSGFSAYLVMKGSAVRVRASALSRSG